MKTCEFEGCDRKHRTKGYCASHYSQFRLGKELTPLKPRGDGSQGCKFEGCEQKHHSNGYCRIHSKQKRKGKELKPKLILYRYPEDWEFNYDRVNEILYYEPKTGELHWKVNIATTRLKDVPANNISGSGYKSVCINGKQYQAHRIIYMLEASEKKCRSEGAAYREMPRNGDTIHHKNGNRLDNRIENLEYRIGHHGPNARGEDLRKENELLREENELLRKRIEILENGN